MRTCVNGLIDRLNINNSSYDWMPRYNHTIRTVPDTTCQLVYPALFSIYAIDVLIFSALRF